MINEIADSRRREKPISTNDLINQRLPIPIKTEVPSSVTQADRKKSHPFVFDALISGFPAGTVSGAPKIRAMEIIEELENVNRGFYGGAMGYFDSNGQMDTCISLRTGLIKDNNLYVQAGGGVVYDSDPEKEFQETINKAQAIIAAALDSYRGLDL
jgi:anthranilate/para-aminobenzoate synthase component I